MTASIAIDVRIVSATNRDLRREVEAGRFREDLFYRLAVVEVTVPPLRDRLDDIPQLVDALLAKLAGEGRKPPRLTGAAGLSVLAHLEDLVTRGAVETDGAPAIDGIYRMA